MGNVFDYTPKEINQVILLTFKKQRDRFPKGKSQFDSPSFFEPLGIDQLETIEKVTKGLKDQRFIFKKDKFYNKIQESKLPRFLLFSGDRFQLGFSSEVSLKENNYWNRDFHIDPIRKPGKKYLMQKIWMQNDIRHLLIQKGYLKNYIDIKSPVKEYISNKNKSIFKELGIFKIKESQEI